MKPLLLALGVFLLAGVALLVSRGNEAASVAVNEASRPDVLLEGVVLSEHTPEGDVVVEIGEVARVPGRIGFLRSPLVPAVELRDVTVRRGGEVVERRDRVHLSGRDLRGEQDLGGLVSGWTDLLQPKERAPGAARARFEAKREGAHPSRP